VAVAAGVLSIWNPSAGWADKITLQTGKTYDCDVIAEDATTVTVDLSNSTRSLFGRFPRTQITAWEKTQHVGQAYVILPVCGMIGRDVTGDGLRTGLVRALKLKPKFIVLYIDSDGGIIGELETMVQAVQAVPRDVQVVAYVKHAYSAAAVLAMCCPRIFMAPDCVLGAAVPYRRDKAGLPQDLDEKVKSTLEAKQRTWIAAAGHDDLLLRGMMESDLEIYLGSDANGNPVLSTSPPGKLLKGADDILTLTAADAAQCGLAQIAPDCPSALVALAKGPVYETSRRPGEAVMRVSRRRHDELIRAAALAKIWPEINAINTQTAPLVAKIQADNAAIETLVTTSKQEITSIDAECRQDMDLALHQANPADTVAHAKQVRDVRVQKVVENCNDAIAPLKAEMDEATVRLKTFQDRVNQLMATVPDFVD
jgi:hypothetical protein